MKLKRIIPILKHGKSLLYLESFEPFTSHLVSVWLVPMWNTISLLFFTLAPISIGISEFFGPARIIVFASILSSTALLLTWANTFFQLGYFFDLLNLGILQGFASSLIYGPSIAVISDYFPHHQRSLATGITTCGSPVGAIIYGFFIFPLFETFGWRGSLAIIAAINLHGVLCGLSFLRSLKPKFDEPGATHHKEGETFIQFMSRYEV